MTKTKYIKEINVRKASKFPIGKDFIKGLDEEVPKIVKKAEQRCRNNKRKRLMKGDI